MALIANRTGVTLAALIAANPEVTNPDLIYPGQILNLPRVNLLSVTAVASDVSAQGGLASLAFLLASGDVPSTSRKQNSVLPQPVGVPDEIAPPHSEAHSPWGFCSRSLIETARCIQRLCPAYCP
jgi:hypothetical protein